MSTKNTKVSNIQTTSTKKRTAPKESWQNEPKNLRWQETNLTSFPTVFWLAANSAQLAFTKDSDNNEENKVNTFTLPFKRGCVCFTLKNLAIVQDKQTHQLYRFVASANPQLQEIASPTATTVFSRVQNVFHINNAKVLFFVMDCLVFVYSLDTNTIKHHQELKDNFHPSLMLNFRKFALGVRVQDGSSIEGHIFLMDAKLKQQLGKYNEAPLSLRLDKPIVQLIDLSLLNAQHCLPIDKYIKDTAFWATVLCTHDDGSLSCIVLTFAKEDMGTMSVHLLDAVFQNPLPQNETVVSQQHAFSSEGNLFMALQLKTNIVFRFFVSSVTVPTCFEVVLPLLPTETALHKLIYNDEEDNVFLVLKNDQQKVTRIVYANSLLKMFSSLDAEHTDWMKELPTVKDFEFFNLSSEHLCILRKDNSKHPEKKTVHIEGTDWNTMCRMSIALNTFQLQ